MYYTKSSLIRFTKNAMENNGFIAIKYDLSRVWRNFADIPTEGDVRYFIIEEEKTKAGKMYGYDIDLRSYCSTCQKKSAHSAVGIFAELLDNLDQILAGDYVSKAKRSAQKKEEAAARKKAKEELLKADCKTFRVDFFDEENGGFLDSIDEIGKRLQNGQYSDLVLNDLITLSYRTTSKNRNSGYTVSVTIGEDTRHFEYDSKYGDLWEDLDDNLRAEILKTMLCNSSFSNSEIEMAFARSEWIDKFIESECDRDGNKIMYDLLSIYFSPDSFSVASDASSPRYTNIYDKDGYNLGGTLREYFCAIVPSLDWINRNLKKLSEIPELKKLFEKK